MREAFTKITGNNLVFYHKEGVVPQVWFDSCFFLEKLLEKMAVATQRIKKRNHQVTLCLWFIYNFRYIPCFYKKFRIKILKESNETVISKSQQMFHVEWFGLTLGQAKLSPGGHFGINKELIHCNLPKNFHLLKTASVDKFLTTKGKALHDNATKYSISPSSVGLPMVLVCIPLCQIMSPSCPKTCTAPSVLF